MNNKIVIFTGEIQSGKTTSISQFYFKKSADCDGFLTPDIEGKRIAILLDSEEKLEFQLVENSKKESINTGKFRFSFETFEVLKKKITILNQSPKKFIIIDEIGRLEIENQGLEPEISRFISKFKESKNGQTLILLIRNSLIEKVKEKYGVESSEICNSLIDLNQKIV